MLWQPLVECLPENCSTCPSPALTSAQQALFKCHRDVSHLYRLYVDCGPKLCSEFSSLITMSSLVWCSATKASFTGAVCLLSSISLEFQCSGWEVPEAWRQTWSQWRNMVLPSPTWQTPSVLYQWHSQGSCSKLWDSISWKMTLLQHNVSLECFYFLLRYMRHITGKLYSYIISKGIYMINLYWT